MKLLRIILPAIAIMLWTCGADPAESTTEPPAAPDIPISDTTVLTLDQLPEQVPQAGTLAAARTWTDAIGPHLLTVFIQDTELMGGMAEAEEATPGRILLAQQYRLRNDSIAATEWMWESLVDPCPLDLTLRLDTVYLTDLDMDQRQEVTLVVSRSCKGDVSPDELQIVLHEDTDRMLLEGYHWLPQPGAVFDTTLGNDLAAIATAVAERESDVPLEYGRYRKAEGFAGHPEIFREFAEQLWAFHREQ